MTYKATMEQRRARRDAILAETRADMERARVIGEKAEKLYEEAMRRRFCRSYV